jgi:hypothetical protein
VVGVRVDFRAAQFLTAGHVQTIGEFLNLGPHTAEVLRHCRHAVAFLHAQFGGASEC